MPEKIYDENFHPLQAYRYCLLGATNAQLADFFEVSPNTIHDWMRSRPEFAERVRAGRAEADARVAESLYKRATGYEVPDVKIFQYDGSPVYADYTKIVEPDVGAAQFWLTNRQPQNWKMRRSHEVSGPDGGPIQTENKVSPRDLVAERLAQIASRTSGGSSGEGSS